MGGGPTQRQRTQRECAKERRYVDQVCDVIINGDLLEECEQEQYDFVPSKKLSIARPIIWIKGLRKGPKRKREMKVQRNCHPGLGEVPTHAMIVVIPNVRGNRTKSQRTFPTMFQRKKEQETCEGKSRLLCCSV